MRETLDETLQDLHQQLASVEDLDAEHIEMLRTALAAFSTITGMAMMHTTMIFDVSPMP